MTGSKRFRLREPTIDDTIGCSEISDNGEWITYGEIVELLNEFVRIEEENKELKKENKKLIQIIDAADDLIKSHLSSHYNRNWECYCKNNGLNLKELGE